MPEIRDSAPSPQPAAAALRWSAVILGGEPVVLRGLRDGGSPWLLQAGDRQVVLRTGTPGHERQIATEAAGLARAAGLTVPVPELLGHDDGRAAGGVPVLLSAALPGSSIIPPLPVPARLRALGAAAAALHAVPCAPSAALPWRDHPIGDEDFAALRAGHDVGPLQREAQAALDAATRARAAGSATASGPSARSATTPRPAARSVAARDRAAPDRAAPGHAAPDHAARDRAARDHAATDRAARDRAAPGHAAGSAGTVLVHGDLWQGNTLWVGDTLTGLVDWDAAGAGAPGIDLGSLRMDAALCYGAEVGAADEVTAGWEAAAGRPAEDVPYWDLVAALATPPGLGWFPESIAAQGGRPDLTRELVVRRHADFLGQALDQLR
jgi:aminoglycoside phosphotransferase (APT) family kinase protein